VCWGVPGKVIEVDGMYAKVNVGGTVVDAIISVEDVGVGDYVMVHAGLIVGKLSEEEFLNNLALLAELQVSNYINEGLDEASAREKAIKEFNDMVSSLGINLSNYQGVLSSFVSNQLPDLGNEGEVKAPPNSYVYKLRTTLSDTDYLQVVHYSNYLKFCERAWSELLSSLGFSYSRLIHEYGVFIPTTEINGRILRPSRLDNDLEIRIWIESLTNKSIKWKCIVRNVTSGNISAELTHTALCTDTALTQSLELPKELVEKLMKYLAPSQH